MSSLIKLIKLESIEILSPEFYPQIDEQTPAPAMVPPAQILENFQCRLCPLKFSEKHEFHAHIRGHFKSFVCKHCGKTLIGDKQLTYHMNNNHGDGKKKISERTKSASKVKIEKLGTNNGAEQLSGDSVDLNQPSRPTENDSICNCDICGRLFPNDEAVLRHKKTHSVDEKRFVCDLCRKGFNKKTNLEFHMRIHTNERPFSCDQCNKSFAHVSGLNCHRRIHTGERPLQCPFCEKCYAHSTDLRRHRRTHGMEEKRFECTLCGKQFYENKFLRTHMSTHHRGRSDSVVKLTSKTDVTDGMEIVKEESLTNEEYIDYEYIQSD